MLEHILSFDFSDRVVHAHDASLYRMLPQAVARPQSDDDVRALIAWARERRSGLTFRTGGTSLSGQAVTDGILVQLGRAWDYIRVEEKGDAFVCGPALRGGVANAALAKFQRRIGPDPASLQAACLGGIVANNASGMCCGVEENSYHTLVGMRLILPSGLTIDTRLNNSDEILREKAPEVYSGLLALRDKILASDRLVQLIRRKSATKNTTGYGLHAFLDHASASQILAHAMVGSEGTLGFISELTLRSVPLRPHRASALLSFQTLEKACELAPQLRAAGSSAIELLDFASVQTLLHRPEVPSFLRDLSREGACLLLQIQADTEQQLNEILAAHEKFAGDKLIQHKTEFFADQRRQNQLWDLRKGVFPAVGARRPKGTTVIIEDVAFPLHQLSQGTRDLQRLLQKHEYHDAVIYGHARDGNLHFVLAQDFSAAGEVRRYERFIDDMVRCVAVEYGGALKAEHGTGRNMAPFVEVEWGAEAYSIMKELKRIVDPDNIFNPGVLINRNPRAHLENLKSTPQADHKIDACIECGFCEPVCPSQGLTLSPRGRIVLERERKLNPHTEIADFSRVKHQLVETCAADGLCASACPVGINTGEWVKQMRADSVTFAQRQLAQWSATEMPWVEKATALTLKAVTQVENVLGSGPSEKISRHLNRGLGLPVWQKALRGKNAKTNDSHKEIPQADYLLFRACVTRALGTSCASSELSTAEDTLLLCSQRAGIHLRVLFEAGLCCGQPWSSKGFKQQSLETLASLIDRLFKDSQGGKIPVIVDNSPCAKSMFDDVVHLSSKEQEQFAALRIIEPLEYALQLSERLKLNPIQEPVRFFPVCSVRRAGRVADFEKLARKIARTPLFPKQEACCGMAGDRGLWRPELSENALARFHWDEGLAQVGFATSRTCEVALSASGIPFVSIFDALERASRGE